MKLSWRNYSQNINLAVSWTMQFKIIIFWYGKCFVTVFTRYWFRSSHSQMFFIIGISFKLSKFRRKTPVLVSLFRKFASLLLKKNSNTGVFLWQIEKWSLSQKWLEKLENHIYFLTEGWKRWKKFSVKTY